MKLVKYFFKTRISSQNSKIIVLKNLLFYKIGTSAIKKIKIDKFDFFTIFIN